MGTWGRGAFDNDAASDWSSDLTDAGDLSLVEDTLSSAEEADEDELDLDLAREAIAACEVVARIQERANRSSSNMDEIDQWIRSIAAKPSPSMVRSATNVLDRVAKSSELAPLRDSARDLRRRVAG
ncbi:MAG: DUF4259 domain-containing protein [Deltaproteobacteria bacterium]|nr:DUF4259 domain-containing protein [Deltaproteobacteria bacterium]